MQVGAVSHIERLKELLVSLDSKKSREAALENYNKGVLADTMAWGEIGLQDFMPELSREESVRLYNESISKWRSGEANRPVDLMKRSSSFKAKSCFRLIPD